MSSERCLAILLFLVAVAPLLAGPDSPAIAGNPAAAPAQARPPGNAIPIAQMLSRGQSLLANGQIPEAEREFLIATKNEPGSVAAWNLLGLARYQARSWDGALEAFEHAQKLSPRLPTAYANAGMCEFEMQRYDAAAGSLGRAVSLDPAYGLPHLGLGRIASARGDIPLAESELRKAVALSPGDPMARYFLGLLLFQSRRYPEAIASFEESLRLSPDLPSAHLNLGLTLIRTGDETQGQLHLKRFKALTEVQIADARLRMDITRRLTAARLEFEAGRVESALALVLETQTLAPDQPAVHAYLAEIYARQGRHAESAHERSEFERLSRDTQKP